jgi:hypothetical protein
MMSFCYFYSMYPNQDFTELLLCILHGIFCLFFYSLINYYYFEDNKCIMLLFLISSLEQYKTYNRNSINIYLTDLYMYLFTFPLKALKIM